MSKQRKSLGRAFFRRVQLAVESLEPRRLLSGLNVSAQSFAYQVNHSLVTTFDKDVAPTFGPEDIAIDNLTVNAPVANARKNVSYSGNTVTTAISPILEDGNYEANVLFDGLAATDGSTLASDAHLDFFVLGGDANHDRAVDGIDQSTMFANYGAYGVGYSGGDFDYSGQVNMLDFNILSGHYGTTLQAAPLQIGYAVAFTRSSSSLILNWVFQPDVDGYRVYRSSDSVNFAQIGQVVQPSNQAWLDYQDVGLTEGTKYWYRIRPFTNAAGNGPSYSRISAVTTLHAPMGLQASAVQDDRVTLSWQDTSVSETGFTIQRAIGTGTFADLQTVPATTTTFTATGLNENTSYRWRVMSRNSVALSAYTPAQTTVTKLRPVTHVLASNLADDSGVTVSWEAQSAVATDYLIERFVVTDGVIASSPESSVTVAAGVSSHTFSGAGSSGSWAFKITAQKKSSDTVVNSSPASEPEQNYSEPTGDWTTAYFNQQTSPGVSYQLSPLGSPVGVYHNETVTLTLAGLPRHTWSRVAIDIPVTGGGFYEVDSTSDFTATAGGHTLYKSVTRQTQPGYTSWHLYLANNYEDQPDAFEHIAPKMTVTIQASGIPYGWNWSLYNLTVQTYLPHVTLEGGGTAIEDGYGDGEATFAVRRNAPGSNTISATSLPVNIYDAGGTALPGSDYSPISSLTIPAGTDEKNVTVNPIDNDTIESRFEAIKLQVGQAKTYALADPNAAPAEAQIRDEDWRLEAFSVNYASQAILYDSGPDQAENGRDRYTGSQWIDKPIDGSSDSGVRPRGGSGSRIDGTYGYPISLFRSTPGEGNSRYVNATPRFEIRGNPPEGQWTLDGSASGPGGGTFSVTQNVLQVLPEGHADPDVLSMVGQFSQALPQTIDNGDFSANWTLTAPNGFAMSYAGTTKNHIYVTGATTPNGAFETVLDIGSRNAKDHRPKNPGEAPQEAIAKDKEVFDLIWGDFEGPTPGVLNAAGEEMVYWGAWSVATPDEDPEPRTVAGLLKHRDGTCEAWANLLIEVASIQGVASVMKKLQVREALRPTALPIPGNGVAAGTVIQIKPMLRGQGDHAPPGQNTSQVLFSNHAIVQLSNEGNSSVIYDPSYGSKHISLKAWETASVEVYGYHYDLNGDGKPDTTVPLWEGQRPPQPDQSEIENTEFY